MAEALWGLTGQAACKLLSWYAECSPWWLTPGSKLIDLDGRQVAQCPYVCRQHRSIFCTSQRQVVVGAGDPNPLVAAAGIATLQAAGIEVAMMDGAENQRAKDINVEFLARMEEEAKAEMARLEALAKLREGSGTSQ